MTYNKIGPPIFTVQGQYDISSKPLVMLSGLDALLTHFLVTRNLASEGNFFCIYDCEPVFFAVKFFGALIAAFILWDISRRHRRLGLTAASCSVAAYSLIVLWNLSLFTIPVVIPLVTVGLRILSALV
jgi:hypothetical protein